MKKLEPKFWRLVLYSVILMIAMQSATGPVKNRNIFHSGHSKKTDAFTSKNDL